MTENTTTSGAADFPEFPGHPEPQIMRWSALESEAIRQYGTDMFRAGRLAASAPVAPTQPASKRLIGWRTPDYLEETADAAMAKHWSVHHDLLPIFEGDVHTKLATPQAAPVAPAPQPVEVVTRHTANEWADVAINGLQWLRNIKEGASDLDEAIANMEGGIKHCRDTQETEKVRLAAAPKAAPAINKGSDIIDAYGMTPGQPERVADIPGLAEALEAAFADGSAQVTGALQQGEYLPLPDADTHCYDEDTGKDVWSYSADLVRKVIDSDRAMRTAPQGDVAAWLVLADGEPHHVTPGKSDDAARLWAEDQTKCGAPYSFTFLPLCPPAAQPQRAAPAPVAEDASLTQAARDVLTERQRQIERGPLINLNHERFHTNIAPPKGSHD